MSKLKELREGRGKLHYELSQVLAGADNQESRDKAKKLIDAMNAMKVEIDAIESQGLSSVGTGIAKEPEVAYRRAFMNFLRVGENRLSETDRAILSEYVPKEGRSVTEGNVQNMFGSYSSLGYFVPQGFVYDVEQATKWFAPLMSGDVFTIMDTATGNPLPWPISNDTTNSGYIVGEGAVTNELDITASFVKFGAYKFTSGLVQASLELIQDSAFPLESWLAQQFGVRLGRAFEYMLTQGEGVTSGEPTGLLTAVATGGGTPIIAAGSSESTGGAQTGANSIGYSDLVNLEHAVDPSYRRNGKFMFHDQTLSSLQRIIDKYGRPLWTPGVAAGVPDRILGYEYVVNQSMPQIAASNVTVAFGDMKKYVVRRVKDFSVIVLRERYAELGIQGYLGFSRIDGNLLDAGTHPIAVLQQHS